MSTNKGHKLTDIEAIKSFIFAGKATMTLESNVTGKWFTYRVNKKVFKKEVNGELTENVFYFVSVLTGSDNESSYTYMGSLTNSMFLNLTKKSKITSDAVSYKALNFFVSLLKKNKLHEDLNFYHDGNCGKCGKKLTTPESVTLGLGPICRGYQEMTPAKARKKKMQKLNRKMLKTK